MSERQTTRDFEDDVRRAMRSYADEGARAFDPGHISAQARSAGAGVRWLPGRTSPLVGLSGLRFALLLVLLGAALAAVALVGSRLATPPVPVPGLLAVAAMDQILEVDPSSGTSHAITAPTPHDGLPVWSPDGRRLALSQHDGRGRLQLIDADGGNRHPIADGLTSGDPVDWSPDGTRIAFVGYRYPGGNDRGLYVVDADGAALRRLVPDVGSDVGPFLLGSPAWSPDGSMIAFAAFDPESPIDSARMSVRVVDVASGKVTAVSHSPVDVRGQANLAWRPGRTALLYPLYSGHPGGLEHESIVLAERVGDSWRERPLVTDSAPSSMTFATWLDPERFVYERDDNHLSVANLDGRPELAIGANAPDLAGPGCVAPDGSVVAVPVADVPADESHPTYSLLLMPTNGGPATRVFSGAIDLSGPACSWQAIRP